MNKKLLSLTLMPLLLQSCVMAPLSTETTARTSGKGNWSTNAGGSNLGYAYLRQSYGVSDNFDLGVMAEMGLNNIIGATAQYAFLNQKMGPSVALVAGAGGGKTKGETSVNGQPVLNDETTGYYAYIGPVVSYKTQYFEPYASARFNYLHLKESVVPKTSDDLNFNVADNDTYGALSAGSNVWFNDHFGLTANVNTLISTHGGKFSKPFLNAGLVGRY